MNKCCKTCHHVNTKSNTEMAKQGFALYNRGPIWNYMPPTGKCNEWRAATAEVQAARVAWLEKAV